MIRLLRHCWISLTVSIALLSVGCSTTPSWKPSELSYELKSLQGRIPVHSYRLPNGLKVLIVEDERSPTLAYQTWFNVGSKDEREGYTGLAHLFEHMMFKGTRSYADGEFTRRMEESGAEGLNAFTSTDYTAYVQEIPLPAFPLLLQLESTRMTQLLVDDASFKTEREVVQNERRLRTENNPDGQMRQELFELVYSWDGHPYRWPIIGYEADLNRMTAGDAESFYREHYRPQNATLVIVGHVKHDVAIQEIARNYGRITNQTMAVATALSPHTTSKTSVQEFNWALPHALKQRRKTLRLNTQVEKILIAYRIPHHTSPHYAPLVVAQALLTSGRSSRLEKALVEMGIATSVGSTAMDSKDPGLFIIGATLQANRSSGEAEKVILREIERLGRGEVSAAELERAKNSHLVAFFETLNSNEGLATFLGESETRTGDFRRAVETHEQMQSVNTKEVREVILKYLRPNWRAVIAGLPTPPGEKTDSHHQEAP